MVAAGEAIEVEALITDRYLESLLLARDGGLGSAAAFGWPDGALDRGVRLASLRLRRDLPRFHPSFRFEERLALRLAEASAALRVAQAAGSEWTPAQYSRRPIGLDDVTALEAMDDPDDEGIRRRARPLLIGGAMASAAISLAGAAIVAWRRNRPAGSPMARAVRAAHAAQAARARHPVGERPD